MNEKKIKTDTSCPEKVPSSSIPFACGWILILDPSYAKRYGWQDLLWVQSYFVFFIYLIF